MWVGTVDAGAFTMDCCRFGQGRETLVILPGISLQRVMGTAGAIAGAYRKLAESCEICVFERRNDMPPGYGVRDMALDTARAMEALGLGPAHLFGASQGGMMAMALAALRPELVKRLILGSTSARISDRRYGAVFEPWARLARAGDAAALCRTFAEAVYPRRVFGKLGPLLSELAEAVTEEDLERFAIQVEALRGLDLEEDLGRIACPTLVIGDRDDAVVGGEASGRIAARIPGAELFMYEGWGHAAYDLARDYKARMLAFLAESAER